MKLNDCCYTVKDLLIGIKRRCTDTFVFFHLRLCHGVPAVRHFLVQLALFYRLFCMFLFEMFFV